MFKMSIFILIFKEFNYTNTKNHTTMKKLLVPTDFSQEAENALKVAAQLAKKHNCEIFLLHLLEIPMQQIDLINNASELPEAMFFMKLAQQKFESVLDKDYLQGITVHDTVEFGESFSNLSEIGKSKGADLIVMGSHGASGLKEMFVGSNAEKVVRHSDIPVLVIKNEHTDFDIDNFVFASDFKNDSKDTYKQATKLAEAFNAKMHLVLVNTASSFTTSTKAKQRIQDFIKDVPFDNYTVNIYNLFSI